MTNRSRPATCLDVVVMTPDGGRRPSGLAAWLADVAPRAARGAVTVALVSDRRMRTLNRSFRGVNAATDVLSFPASAPVGASRGAGSSLGDIVIATGVAARQAVEAGHGFGTECRVLALHGLLHLLGYDHEADDGQMVRTEGRLRRRGNLPDGLIDRTRTPRHTPSARR